MPEIRTRSDIAQELVKTEAQWVAAYTEANKLKDLQHELGRKVEALYDEYDAAPEE